MNLVANIKFVQAFSDDDSCPEFLVQWTFQQTMQHILKFKDLDMIIEKMQVPKFFLRKFSQACITLSNKHKN